MAIISTRAIIIGGTPNLSPIKVQDVIDPSIGLVSRAAANSKLRLLCPSGPASDDGDWIEVYTRDRDSPLLDAWTRIYGPIQFTGVLPGGDIPVEIPAPLGTGGFPHGSQLLRHQLFINNFGDPALGTIDRPADVGEFSGDVPLEFDQYTAYESTNTRLRPPAPVYTGALAVGAPVTVSQLVAAGGLQFSIPDNAFPLLSGQWQMDDKINYYFTEGDRALPAEEIEALVPVRPMLQTGNVFTVPASAVTKSGSFRLLYTITDRTGRVSEPSFASIVFAISLAPAPVGLLPIVIDQAPGVADNLLNIADLTPGPTGFIPAYTNVNLTKDEYRVKWGAQAYSPWFRVLGLPVILDKAFLTPLALADYGTTKGLKPTVIQYELRRDGDITPGPITTINVDFSVTGPENPGTPGSENIRLNPVRIFGQGSTELNKLRFQHAGNPVTAEVVLWSGADLPAPGMWLHLVWSDGTFVVPPFEITTQLPGATVRWEFPFSYVAATGNGQQTIHYSVYPTSTPTPDINPNPSPNTIVDVIGAVTSTLAPPRYIGVLGAVPNQQWTCDSVRVMPLTTPNTFMGRLFVPADSRMVVGQPLSLTMEVFRPRTGTRIEAVTHTDSVAVTDAIRASGHFFLVPLPILKVARSGRAESVVTVALSDGTLGRGGADVNVRSTLSQGYCDGSPLVGP